MYILVFGVKYTDIAVTGSLFGSLYNSVTSKSLSFIRSGNFCMSEGEKKIKRRKVLNVNYYRCNRCNRCCNRVREKSRPYQTKQLGRRLAFASVESSRAKHLVSPKETEPPADSL